MAWLSTPHRASVIDNIVRHGHRHHRPAARRHLCLDGDGPAIAVRRRAHHESRQRRDPDRRRLQHLLVLRGDEGEPAACAVPGGARCLRPELGDLPGADLAARSPRQEPGQARGRQHSGDLRHQLHLRRHHAGDLRRRIPGLFLSVAADLHFRRALRSQPRGRLPGLGRALHRPLSLAAQDPRRAWRCGRFRSIRRPPGSLRSMSRAPRRSPSRWAER